VVGAQRFLADCKRTLVERLGLGVATLQLVSNGQAIDRLGRSLIDLLRTIQDLEAVGVDLYLDQQHLDTTTPTGKLLFQVTGAFSEFERAMIRQVFRARFQACFCTGPRHTDRDDARQYALRRVAPAHVRHLPGALLPCRGRTSTGEDDREMKRAPAPYEQFCQPRALR
jgi:hypothetical protein